jgi:23S rRNA (uracil1939-C5)-methyltransferase
LLLTIEKLVYGGDGLARLPGDEQGRGKAVFMPFVLECEEVEAALLEQKPGFARARVEKIVRGSERRVEPKCPYFLRCGGCHYQHAGYEYQLQIKAAILKENLRRIAKLELESELEIHPSSPWNYRNRTRFKIQSSPQFALGYYKFGSHELLPVEECPISSPLINRAMAAFWEQGRAGKMAEGILELELFANAEDTELLIEAYCAPSIDKTAAEQWAQETRRALPEIAGAVVFIGVNTIQPELWVVAGAKELTYNTAHASYRVSTGAFFQVNRHLTDELVRIVTEGRSGTTALDLYAGVGLFSAVLNREFERVIAVESSPTSYADLLYNSAANVKRVRATVEQYLENAAGKLQPDLVVVDPPRAGLGESVIRNLAKLAAPRITYVSCDPATFSRDLRALLQSGYRVEQAHLVDLFPQTYHLESVFHLVR